MDYKSKLRGSIVPVVTPFRNGEFDERAFVDLINWQIASGSHGISVTGTTGEPSSRCFSTPNSIQNLDGGPPPNKRMHPTRAPRSGNGLHSVAQVRASDRVFPDPRERVMLAVGQPLRS